MKKTRLGPLPDLLNVKGVSPKELAQIAGVEPRAIHRLIEGGTKNMSNEKLRSIASALDIEFGDFCDLIRLQRDIRGLIRIREELANLNASLSFWCPPECTEAHRWAPSVELGQSIVAKLNDLLARDFDVPPASRPTPPKLRRPPQASPASDPAAAS